jgi:hypothetical protein
MKTLDEGGLNPHAEMRKARQRLALESDIRNIRAVVDAFILWVDGKGVKLIQVYDREGTRKLIEEFLESVRQG